MLENVLKLDYRDKELYLVKTAHVSKDSIEDVRRCVEEINPDAICIELDEQRYERLSNPDKWRETDIIEVIKKKQVGMLLVNTILASFQKRMAKSLGSNTGGEMMEGIRLSKERNIPLVLADRSIKTTFSRIWNELDTKEKFKMLMAIIESIFSDEEISEEDLAKLKEADALEAALGEVSEQFPTIKRVLVDERDQYLCEKIRTAPGKKIVAIIGAAHSLGIEKYLNSPIDIDALNKVNKKKGLGTYIKYAIPLIIVLLIALTIFRNRDVGLSQIRSWIIWNGGLSALGVLLAFGHPLSILTALIMAPITSLNPLLASGWFAGLVEAHLRKPKVKDFEDLADDTANFRGFWKNGITRTLLVVVFANLFSSIGTFISGIDIVKKFIESL
ncbi:MAG: TraB/GumN family protein [Erysipelotrichaceae bacterium]|nr:TraB/GumN family protein [Erysipelotrichaceae bacterium]